MPLHHPATSSDSRNLFKSKSTGTTFHTRQSRPALLLSIEPTLPSNQQLRPRPFMRGHGSDSQGIYLTYMDGSVLMDSEIGAKLVFLPRIEIGIRPARPPPARPPHISLSISIHRYNQGQAYVCFNPPLQVAYLFPQETEQ